MKLSIITKEGKDTGRSISVSKEVLIEPNAYSMQFAVRLMQNNARQGTASTKEKWAVSYSTKKLYKQKGTGNARAGSRKSGIRRGGGRIFGPQPRDYGFKINKKTKALARKSAFSTKVNKGQLIVMEDLALKAPKTKSFVAMLASMKLQKEKVLFVTAKPERNLVLSARNIQKVDVVTVAQLNTYNLLYASKLIVAESAMELIHQKFA